MYLLSSVLEEFRNAGLKSSVSILFDNKKFSHKIYLFSHTTELKQPTFNKIYNSLTGNVIHENTNSLVVKSISSWVTSGLNFSVNMTSKELSIELGNAPSLLTKLFEDLPSELFNLTIDHTLIEITIDTLNQHTLVDLLLNDEYLTTEKFQLIYQVNNFHKVIAVFESTEKLKTLKKKKLLMDDLINQKLNSLNGKLKGIREEYIINNITFNDYYLICLFYGYENIDDYEKFLKSEFLKRTNSNIPATLSPNDETTTLLDKKLTRLTLIDELLIPSECITIVERIRKFTSSPFNVEKILKVEEYKFEWLQGITPEMIRSFKVFKDLLNDAITGFSINTTLLINKKLEKKTPHETDVDSHVLTSENLICLEPRLSLQTKLKEVQLSVACKRVVNRLNQAKRTSLSVYDFINIESSWFLQLSGIGPKHYSDFLALRSYLQDATKSDVSIKKDDMGGSSEIAAHHLSSCAFEPNSRGSDATCNEIKKQSRIYQEKQDLAECNINSLKPNDICIGDWEDILDVTFKMLPHDKANQFENIKSQIKNFYEVREKYVEGFSHELIKIKETADWHYPGDYIKQLAYLNDEIEKLLPSAAETVSEKSSLTLNKTNEIGQDKGLINSEEKIYTNIPNDILKKIKDCAYEGYFDDKEMYDLFVQEQSDAYLKLNYVQPKEMPAWAWQSICDYTESKYIGDFSGQLREVLQHIESYTAIESISFGENADKLREIKQAAREELPGDYKGQLESINVSLCLLDSEQEEAKLQAIAKQEIASLRPKEIRSWDWEKTLEIALKECPNDPVGQLKTLKLQVQSFYDIVSTNSQGYENEVTTFKELAVELYAGDFVKQLSHLLCEIGKLSSKASLYNKEKHENLSKNTLFKQEVRAVTSAKKEKELNNRAVYDKNKSEKNFLSKLSSIFNTNKASDIIDDTDATRETPLIVELDTVSKIEAVAPDTSIEASSVKELKPIGIGIGIGKEVVDIKVQSKASALEECHFVKFNKKNEIAIEVQALKSFDAFDFESINNKLIVVINSNHPFYSKLYRISSVESKRVIDMMISSLCHLSHLNISETVKQQDKKLFSRWSEYLEEYLLED